MRLATRCPACGETVREGALTRCEDCGNAFHESCADYQRTVECEQCADEPWIGAVEF